MTTIESPQVRALWELIHRYEPGAQFGGSVPDLATEQIHSYHRSWKDSPRDGGYSMFYWGDAHPVVSAREFAAALDVTFSDPELMKRYTSRLHRFAISHPKAYYSHGLREFAGTVDGKTVFAWDLTTHQRTYGWDRSHLWHIHLSFNRRYVNTRRILQLAGIFRP